MYEERLQMQTADFERERKNLQELISRLEVHLADQTKLVEEVREEHFCCHRFDPTNFFSLF